jgi:hypothetical protein
MTEQVKELELENSPLRKAMSNLTLDKLILTEAAKGNFQTPRVAAPASSMCERICIRAPRLRGAWAGPLDSAVCRGGREYVERLSADVIELARQYGRCGNRKVAALCARQAGRPAMAESSGSGNGRG